MDECNLLDMAYFGSQFTWQKACKGDVLFQGDWIVGFVIMIGEWRFRRQL